MNWNLWKRLVNRESVSYVIFDVLTALVDWVVYTVCWKFGVDYRVSTAVSWCAAVLFAFVTNKLSVFQSRDLSLELFWREFVSLMDCRVATGVFTMVAVIMMVDYLHLNEFTGKLFMSAISLVLNYISSKLFIFKKNHDGEDKQYGT